MADKNHSTSRRAVIAALIATPAIVGVSPSIANSVDRSAWDRAFNHYTSEKAASDRHEKEVFEPAYRRFKASLPEGQDGPIGYNDPEWQRLWEKHIGGQTIDGVAIDDWSDVYADNLSQAAGALLRLPAPDQEALLWKLEYLWLGDEGASWSPEIVEKVLADARRLLSNGRA